MAKVAVALTEASVHNDKADGGWSMKATGNSETFGSLFDSGGACFHGLDFMRAIALHSQIKSGGAISGMGQEDACCSKDVNVDYGSIDRALDVQ